ncbi:replication endonuclease [Rhodoferax sp.]|uniref:replication endonuclease n=1 Tax=Rhodoferax sp. TaxID=50421 RepID=UPI0027317157|nr:replication endonuclease [Rhodoferax sp.]MDP2442482.1 replication endonuclease [Rhodoferax sp.]MDZ4209164.1 replication endonuclease [Rhodoferax sp.]
MKKIHSAVAAGDVFAFVDEAKRDITIKAGLKARKSLQAMLLKGVIDRVGLVDIPFKRLRRPWKIDASKLNMAEATHQLKLRVRVARKHGVDVSDLFEICEKDIHEIATRLADILNDQRAKNPHLTTVPGFDDVIQFTGIPSANVANVARWFRRALTKNCRQMADYFALMMMNIGRNASPIVSRPVFESRERQIQRQTDYANTHRFVTQADSGEQISVKFSDPAIDAWRRASKNYIRLKGLDAFCEKVGLKGFFVTITLPGRFHPNPANGKRSWDGSTPVDAHKQLQDPWRSFQKRYGETGGKVFGVRVEEPHDDACPHWHALIYIEPERESDFFARFQAAFGTGIATKIVPIDRSLSTGASYLTKYINPQFSKVEGESASNSPKAKKAALYDAYRATWGNRSIQFFDIPGSSSIWDELRRVRPDSEQFAKLSEDGRLLRSYATSEPPDYGEFLHLLQQMNVDKQKRIHVLYAQRETGSRFIEGFFVDGERIETHQKSWTVEPMAEKSEVTLKGRTVSHSYPSKAGTYTEDLGMETGVQMS